MADIHLDFRSHLSPNGVIISGPYNWTLFVFREFQPYHTAFVEDTVYDDPVKPRFLVFQKSSNGMARSLNAHTQIIFDVSKYDYPLADAIGRKTFG